MQVRSSSRASHVHAQKIIVPCPAIAVQSAPLRVRWTLACCWQSWRASSAWPSPETWGFLKAQSCNPRPDYTQNNRYKIRPDPDKSSEVFELQSRQKAG